MDLRRLGHFLAVVDHGGFTAASREVPVSQPALSLAVKELEAELGVELIVRTGRRIRLTPAGEALVGPARQALRDVETGRAAVAAIAGLDAGSLTLASLPTLAADPLAEIVGQFRAAHPAVTLELVAPEDTVELSALVRSGQCELGIGELEPQPPGLVAHALGSQELLLVLPRAMAPAARTLRLSELGAVPFVAAPRGTSVRRLLDEGFAATGQVPLVAVVTSQRDAIVPLVLAGAGAALVPASVAATARRLGAVVKRPEPAISRRLALVHRDGPLAPAAARFAELALAAAGKAL